MAGGVPGGLALSKRQHSAGKRSTGCTVRVRAFVHPARGQLGDASTAGVSGNWIGWDTVPALSIRLISGTVASDISSLPEAGTAKFLHGRQARSP